MGIFQLIGDMLHLLAMILLLRKIFVNRNVVGLSYKTQQIYVVVFLTRYVDIFMGWKTLYLFSMKLIFIGVGIYTAYLILIRKPFCLSYDKENDSFPHYYLYLAAGVLTLIIHRSFSPMHLIWSYSIWLESLAILPQLMMIAKNKDIENFTAHYILFLGLYRIFYVLHWFNSWNTVVLTSFLAGLLQSALYADFIYYFFKSNHNEKYMQFPV